MKKILGAAALATTMATGAMAATTTINLFSGGDATVSGNTGTFASGDFSGTITGLRVGSTTHSLTQSIAGLGVTGGGDTDPLLDGRIDESITFSFDQTVRLVSVTFYAFDADDTADVYVNGVMVADESATNPYMFGYEMANSFTIGADGSSVMLDGYDNFFVKSFTVAAVPVPAAGFLLLGGLAGLGLVRKRRKSA